MKKTIAIATFIMIGTYSHVALAYDVKVPIQMNTGGLCMGPAYVLTPEFLTIHPQGFGGSWNSTTWNIFSSLARYHVVYGGITGDPLIEGTEVIIHTASSTGSGWPQMSASRPEERSVCMKPSTLQGYGTVTVMIDTADGQCEYHRTHGNDWNIVDCANAGGIASVKYEIPTGATVYNAIQMYNGQFGVILEQNADLITEQKSLLDASGASFTSYEIFQNIVNQTVDFGLFLVQVSWPFLLGIAFIYLLWRLAHKYKK